MVPIFALDSVSQVRLIPHSISTLLRVLGEFFVKLILLHDTDTHRNDRVEKKEKKPGLQVLLFFISIFT